MCVKCIQIEPSFVLLLSGNNQIRWNRHATLNFESNFKSTQTKIQLHQMKVNIRRSPNLGLKSNAITDTTKCNIQN